MGANAPSPESGADVTTAVLWDSILGTHLGAGLVRMLRVGPHGVLTHCCLNRPGRLSKYVLLQLFVPTPGQLRRKGSAAVLRPACSAKESRTVPAGARAAPSKEGSDASVIGGIARQLGDAVLLLTFLT